MMIRISAGTAELLGMKNSIAQVLPTMAYLMQGEHCTNNCSFCTQARDSSSKGQMLSRITWPSFNMAETLEALTAASAKNCLKRVCIQVVCGSNLDSLIKILPPIKAAVPGTPLSISAALGSMEAVVQVMDAGADVVNLSLDGASPGVYETVKKKSWEAAWQLLAEAAKAYPKGIRTHLIAGLGETEKDIVETVQKCAHIGVGVGLFAFTPVRGTPLEHRPQPPLPSYRRLQAAVFLITGKLARAEQFSFDSRGNLIDLGLEEGELRKILGSGKAFETSGCSGCNRPYYNESPRQTPYNYPRPLTGKEIEQAIEAVLSRGGL